MANGRDGIVGRFTVSGDRSLGDSTPMELEEALDRSFDDLKHGGIEDASALLDEMRAFVDDYRAKKNVPPSRS